MGPCVDSFYHGVPLYWHTSLYALRFVVLHRCRVFYKLEAKPATSKKITFRFVATLIFFSVGWNQTHRISEVCL